MIVVWRITQQCNLSCPFCAYDRRMKWPRRQADVATVRQFGAVLAEYQKATGDSVLVSWIGGEPLLFPPLAALTEYFVDDLGLRVSTTTNGSCLGNAAVRSGILAHYSELTISVDGIGAVHDQLRDWPGGYAALRESVRELAQAKRDRGRGPILRANVVLMRQTVDAFPALCLELADWGIEAITFNQLGGRDRPEFFGAHRLLPEQVARLEVELPRLREKLVLKGVRLAGSDAYLRRIGASSRDEALTVEDCRPGERFLFINEMGVAAPCNFTVPDYGVPIGVLNSASALLALPGRFAVERATRRSVHCEDCHSTQVFEKFAMS